MKKLLEAILFTFPGLGFILCLTLIVAGFFLTLQRIIG